MTPEEQAFAAFAHAVDAIYFGLGVLSAGMCVVAVILVILSLRRDHATLLSAGAICWLSATILGLVWIGQGLWPLAVLQAGSVPAVVTVELARRRFLGYLTSRRMSRSTASQTDVVAAG
ncbi:hypothetical protein NFX31_09900 [Microbacterium azadirachtae]|uniref:Uncharacterized protein n=1 Tax=Microbacterium azadirachtae TaxID=582680 RepID=A0A0F0KVF5_9MICO|nr:hypothetical protein [Microbacterium azadirachtae]KJL24892.1 hypothetical protein RL72_01615 [Microbacterium azadirachtae]UXW84556.1 hypothetical protein NFX31_09900 [Microbacterium azadirachtae]